jgi:hypothetical protein
MKIQSTSKYITPGVDVKDGDHIRFKNEGAYEEGSYGLKLVMDVELPDGKTKKLSLNNTSVKNMTGFYGTDTKNWIGKEARCNVGRQMVGKEFKDVLVLTAPNIDLTGRPIVE